MSYDLLHRNTKSIAEEILSDTPVLSVSGARQVGKSTLASQLLLDRPSRFVNLDETSHLTSAREDPDGFVRMFPKGTLAIDEIQRAPELFRAIKGALEEDRRPGRFIITGSSNLLNLQGAEESLAGRAETLVLRGFSRGERNGFVEDFANFAWGLDESAPPHTPPGAPVSRGEYLEMLTEPSFPELRKASERRRDRWVNAYVNRVLSKDATTLFGLQFPDRLHTILNKIAATGTAEFVATTFGRDLSIPSNSIPSYLHALESVYLVDSLPAWGTNLGKRAISKPKVFVSDPGLAVSLAGVDASALEDQITSVFTGGLLESFVASELLKQQAWSRISYKMFHFRSSAGQEVDLILENRRREIVGLEVKASVSFSSKFLRGLTFLRDLYGDKFKAGIVLHAGTEILPMGDRLWAMPISTLWRVQ